MASIVTRSTHGTASRPSTTTVTVEGDEVVVEVSGILRNLRLPRPLLAALLEERDHEHCAEQGACWQDREPCPALPPAPPDDAVADQMDAARNDPRGLHDGLGRGVIGC